MPHHLRAAKVLLLLFNFGEAGEPADVSYFTQHFNLNVKRTVEIILKKN